MGCSTFANYTVLPEIALAKIRADAPFDKVCYIGCGVTTGIGAVHQHGQGRAGRQRRGVRAGRHRPQRGAGRAHGGRRHDRRRRPQSGARGAGAQVRHDPLRQSEGASTGDLVAHLVELTGGGADYSFECVGNVDLMRQALECCHRGWGVSVIIGVAGAGQEIAHAAVPAGHRARVEGHGVRRRARPHRRAADRRLVHGRQDRHRQPDHAQAAARAHQRGVRPDARGRSRSARSSSSDDAMAASRRCRSSAASAACRASIEHDSSAPSAVPMRFARLPAAGGARGARVPAVYYLAGLTCTEETFAIKAGAQRVAAELGLALVTLRHQPAQRARPRRRRELGLRPGRRLLPRRHGGALVGEPIACRPT